MIARSIRVALSNPLLVALGTLALVAAGVYSLQWLSVDAFPDVTPVLVEVVTTSEGLAPQEVEQLVTYPIEAAMNGLPRVDRVQSLSIFGLSDVKIYFQDGVDIYFARQLVRAQLQSAAEQIPADAGEPELAPISTALGQVYQYVLRGRAYDNSELRTIQDWVVRRALRTVSGVADVVSFGGLVKQFQVRVDPRRLQQYDLSLADLADALHANNRNVGGGFLETDSEESLVRGLGRVSTTDEIGSVVIAIRGGAPIRIREVADIEIGAAVRRGAVIQDDKGEVVAGIVLKRIGENTADVVARVKAKVDEINRSLPAGVQIVPFYDQSDLVHRAIATVRDALLEGGVLVLLVLVLFLGDLRSALVVAITLPLSLLAALSLMHAVGMSANLMSLGGLAIGLGMMVDGGVVVVENVYRRLSEDGGLNERASLVQSAAEEVGRPVVFSITIIIVVFLPLFTLQGIEGKLFKPLAVTISFAMFGSLVCTLTVIPLLCALFIRTASEEGTWIMRWLAPRYRALLARAAAWPRLTITLAVVALLASLVLIPFLGTEFVPALEEGSLLLRMTYAPSTSLNEVVRTTNRVQRRILNEFGGKEVLGAVAYVGRAEAGGEPEPVNNVEMIMDLSPEKSWRFRSKAELIDAMDAVVGDFPGIKLNFSQPIEARVDELVSGVRAQLAIKLFGDDLETLEAKGDAIAAVIDDIPGAEDLQVEQVAGQPATEVSVDRSAIAQYGLSVDDVLRVVRVGVGGETAGQIYEGPRRFDILLRLQQPFRDDPSNVGNLLVQAPSGGDVPIAQVARVATLIGPKQISHEAGQRRIVIQANVRGRDLGGFVQEARQAVDRQVKLPPGYSLEWAGQFENQQRAMKRLAVIVPLTVGLIFLLLYLSLGSLKLAALIILNVPFALIGGIVALFVTGQYLSVPASVGFIALFGVAVLNGVVLVTYIKQLRDDGMGIGEAVETGAGLRLRPVLMTALVASLGLVPLLFSRGAGSDVQRPLAAVVVGGLITSTLLTLLLLPTIYRWFDPVGHDRSASADPGSRRTSRSGPASSRNASERSRWGR